MGHDSTPSSAAVRPRTNKWFMLLIILCAPFLAVIDTFIFNVAIPSVQTSLHANSAEVQLIVAGYILPYATLLITGGRLGDMYGRKKMFLWGMGLFCLASLFGAFVMVAPQLILVRIFQGMAAAMMYPQALSLIQVTFKDQERTFALSIFGIVLGSALIVGQLVGGVLIQLDILHLAWRPIFLITLPLGLLAIVLALRYVGESRASIAPRLDVRGVLLLSTCLLLTISFLVMGRELSWPIWMWLLLACGLAAGVVFIWHEKKLSDRGRHPLFHLSLFKSRSFVLGIWITLAFYAGQGSFFLLLTLFLQHGLKLSSLAAGVALMPLACGFLAASFASPRILPRMGKYVLTTGSAASVAGVIALSFLAFNDHLPSFGFYLGAALFVLGSGYGLLIPPLIGIILRGVPEDYAGSASGALVTVQQLASALGIAIIGIPFFNILRETPVPQYASAFGYTMHYTAGLFVATALLVNFLNI